MVTKIVQAVLAVALFASPMIVAPPGTAEARTQTIPAEQGLQSNIQSYISGLGATYGVSVVNLSDGSVVAVNDESLFPTASLYKLLVMYRVFQAVNRGNLSLNDRVTIRAADLAAGESAAGFSPGDAPTVGYALNRMITVSSNAAAYALTRVVGGWSQVASAAGELGMYNTTLTDDFWGTPQRFRPLLPPARQSIARESRGE